MKKSLWPPQMMSRKLSLSTEIISRNEQSIVVSISVRVEARNWRNAFLKMRNEERTKSFFSRRNGAGAIFSKFCKGTKKERFGN